MDIFNHFRQEIVQIAQNLAKKHNITINCQNITCEPCKNTDHGDLASNAAMVLSKQFKQNPQNLAKEIIDQLSQLSDIRKIDIAGPGFINIKLNNDFLLNFAISYLKQQQFIYPDIGQNQKVNLEYASPNPTGPMHIGHTRGAIFGDVLANLLQKCGYDITKEFYINDAGVQIDNLVDSAFIRYLQALGEDVKMPENSYPGEYLIDVGCKIKEEFSDSLKDYSPDKYLPILRDFVVNLMLGVIKSDLQKLGIKHDLYFSEKKNLHDSGKIAQIIEVLKKKNLIYKGVIDPPKGKLPKNYRSQEQSLFRSTDFGDDSDRVVQKADGSYSYFAADLAYINDKINRGATKIILPLGFDHAGYVKRFCAATKAISDGKAEAKIILCQLVKFSENGVALKMSKRAGNFICASDVVDKIGADVIRFIMLTRKNDAPFDFDLAKVIEQSKENPIFYVQYAHARCCSVLRNAQKQIKNFSITKEDYNLDILRLLSEDHEINLIKKIAEFYRIITMSAINFEPHRIAFYLQELAATFHSLFNLGSENKNLRFINENDINLSKARIILVILVQKTIKEAFKIFNIEPLEEMK